MPAGKICPGDVVRLRPTSERLITFKVEGIENMNGYLFDGDNKEFFILNTDRAKRYHIKGKSAEGAGDGIEWVSRIAYPALLSQHVRRVLPVVSPQIVL